MSDYSRSPDPKGLLERLLDEAEAEDGGESAPSAEMDRDGTSSPESSPQQQQPSSSASPSGSAPMLEVLLSNPSLLTALPGLLENLTPLLGGIFRENPPSAGNSGEKRSPTATVPHRLDRHTALLCALKPYLSPSRREAAETVIRLCRVWDALERSGISLSGLLRRMDPGGGEGDGEKGDGNHVQ